MTKLTEEISQLIDKCSDEERRAVLRYLRERTALHPLETAWNTSAESLLSAIARSGDLTQRGIRGILAEATFEEIIVPQLNVRGWARREVSGHHPYDCFLSKNGFEVRVQIKLQRKEKGRPKEYARRSRLALRHAPGELHCVEVQKTRSGSEKGQSTRPYRFGDFDILAVNLHPSTGDWQRFLYTVGAWLLARKANPKLIEILQPVPRAADEYWTDDFETCVEWFRKKRARKLYKR